MWKATLDLTFLLLRHPVWFLAETAKGLSELRAVGTARFKYRLPRIYHQRLDERFERLPVELGIASYVEYNKAMIIARFCRLLRPTHVLEIGTYRGGMTAHIARNSPDNCVIWTLDLPRERLASVAPAMIPNDVTLAQMDPALVGNEWQHIADSYKIRQIWGDSLSYDYSSLGPFDLIYVDGSHAEPWVQKDTENAFRLLAPTGAILWDDCLWSDVQRVLGRFASDRPIYMFEDNNTAGYLQIDGKPVRVSH